MVLQKKILVLISLILLPIFCLSQKYQQRQETYGRDYWYIANKLYGTSQWNTPSFYWGVSRSENSVNGYYRYKMWFTSNSYVWDSYNNRSVWKYTYIWNTYIYVDGSLAVSRSEGISFRETYCATVLTFYSTNPRPEVLFVTKYKML